MRIGTTMLASLTLLAHPAIAQSGSGTGDDTIEEVLVIAEPDTRIYELAETLDVTPDSAQLLKHAVGANVITNGPISGMAQYRGMSRMRISSRINGQVISPGGPNWMDAPLSYAPAAHLESLEVHRGIASVAAGMETIGGVIDAKTWQGEFAQDGTRVQGRVRAGAHSVNDASLLSGAFVVANRHHRLKLSGLTEGADDAEFPRGTIRPTEYERDRYDVGYGFRTGAHQFQIDYGRNETGDAGTPALPMDIAFVDSDLFGFGYGFDGDHWRLDGRLWASTIDHGMSNYHLRPPPESPAMFRRNVTDVDNLGFSVAVTVGAWRFGLDGHDEVHNSDIDNPNNPLFFVTNFNDAERRLLGAFVEREWALGSGWDLQLG
ncbi:MAG: TonB-dependent receptor, partial [Gammaproteobacteria bacterium]